MKKLSQILNAHMEGVCSMKIIPIQERSTELHKRENCVLFLPVNILSVVCWLSWPHDTLLCVVILLSE